MFVVPAWIAGTQMPGKAGKHYVPVNWIPAIHAGMTLLLKHRYNQEFFRVIHISLLHTATQPKSV